MSSTRAARPGRSAPARVQFSIERLLSRSGLIAGAALLVAAGFAWRWLAASGMSGMEGHDMGAMTVAPWSANYLLSAFVMWAVMMVAMMLPSAAPMILLHARIDRASNDGRRLAHTLLFSLAYLFVWTGFSGAAALAQALLIDLDWLSPVSLALGGRGSAAALLALVALYELSPAKAACLDQCRSPIHYVMRFWAPGAWGTIRLGLVHGLFCVGCCWGLMLLLFVAGVMNLAWIAFLAAIVFAEKLAPPNWHASKLIAALLLGGAGLVLTTS